MEEDVTPSSSYLDLDDPFDTVNCSVKTKTPTGSNDGSESGELTDESRDEKEESTSKVVVKEEEEEEEEEGGEEECPREKEVFSAWCGGADPPEEQISRSMLDMPSLWNFSPTTCKLEDMFGNEENCVSPHILKSFSDDILSSDVSLMQTVPDCQLVDLVTTTARLVHEHERLINSRVKLLESMKEMHKLEKEATVKAISEVNQEQSNEHTKQIVAEMTAKLESLGEDDLDEKENFEPFPSLLDGSSPRALMHPYAVPPPDTARPPPLSHLVAPTLPPLIPDVSRPPPAIPKRLGPDCSFSYPPPAAFIRSPSLLPVRISPQITAQGRAVAPPPFTPMMPPPPFFMPQFPGGPNICVPPPQAQSFVNPTTAFMAPRKRVLGANDDRWTSSDRSYYMGRRGPSPTGRSGYSGNSSPASPSVLKEPCVKKERDL
ncbi:unnamed protein product [Auanema sp. JU1783]|nr:unnamed protein product [Auanema sp. JU1783]